MKKIFISGNFNILHAGHIRLFKFAKNFKGKLIVGVNSDKIAGKEAHVKQRFRLEVIKNNPLVDEAILINSSLEKTLIKIKPNIIIKGKEHLKNFNVEEKISKKIKARLIFGSGETIFSTKDLINKEINLDKKINLYDAKNYTARYKITPKLIKKSLSQFKKINVCIIGDIILDKYINCEPLGMSQEEPVIVIKPVDEASFIGGASIVAGHAGSIGCNTTFISACSSHDLKRTIVENLKKTKTKSIIFTDQSLPSVIKNKYRTDDKGIVRINNIKEGYVSRQIENKIIDNFKKISSRLDLVIFSDFNYGLLTKYVIDKIIKISKEKKIFIAADCQSSSQKGDLSKYKNVDMVTPTEFEARQCLQNYDDGLIVLANKLSEKLNTKKIVLKLGRDGVILHNKIDTSKWSNDRIYALNKYPKDVSGAGDALLIGTSVSLVINKNLKSNFYTAAFIGSLFAAVQVNKIGNIPIKINEILSLIKN